MKETEMKRVPKLRFPEFTDDWEQRKLGEVAKYRNGKAHENDISEQGKYIVVNSKFVSTNGDVCKFSDKQIEPLFKDEIAFVLSDVPNGRAIARTFLVDKDAKYTLNQRIAGITPNENVCPYYLYILMNRNKYFLRFDDGAKQTNLSVTDVMNFAGYYPSTEEQYKIGDFFRYIDNLITLHQRKLEKLKELKKGLVQKLFSQEVRFKADDGSEFPKWEEKKLGDVTSQYKVRNKKRLPLEIYSVNNIVGFIPQSEQFDDAGYLKDTDTSIYMVVPPKHFAYNPARLDIGSIGYQCLDHDVQVSSLYEVFETSDLVNDRFLWSWFHTYYFNNVVKRLQEGGVRLYFYYDKMQEVKIRLPSLQEQQKIADCLSSLDDGIAKQKATLAAWEELKKGLLQQMFV